MAAGRGARFGGYKQLAPLLGKPLLVQTLRAFVGLPFRARVVVVSGEMLSKGVWAKLGKAYPELSEWQVVEGKDERALSVRAGVEATPGDCELVAVHDGARPMPPIEAMVEAISRLEGEGDLAGVAVCSAVVDTIKLVNPVAGRIERTEDRTVLRRAETPQVARRALLLKALDGIGSAGFPTDEMHALEAARYATGFVEHQGINPKVTTPVDVKIVTALLKSKQETGAPA